MIGQLFVLSSFGLLHSHGNGEGLLTPHNLLLKTSMSLSVMAATDMSSATYTKAFIYDGSFTPMKADAYRIRCRIKVLQEASINLTVVSGPTVNVLECAL